MGRRRFRKRVLLGFAVAPLPIVGPLLLMHAALLFGAPPDSPAILSTMIDLVFWSYGATLLIGLPIHLYLRRKGRSSLSAYLRLTVVAALLTGAAAAVGETLFPPSLEDNPFGLTMWGRFGVTATLAFTAIASVSAWVFWRVAVRQTRF